MYLSHTIEMGPLTLADGRYVSAELEIDVGFCCGDLDEWHTSVSNVRLDDELVELGSSDHAAAESAIEMYIVANIRDWVEEESDYTGRRVRYCPQTGAREVVRR